MTTLDGPGWSLRSDYATALPALVAPWQPRDLPAPQLLIVNSELAATLGLDADWLAKPDQVQVLAGGAMPEGARPVAQAYAGHQFGRFSGVLGDGRAVLLGELSDRSGTTVDLALKGSGRTRFSRGGDGLAGLGPVLRELLVSEGMHALGIPTSRALAVTLTGESVARHSVEPGAVLARVASSHLRIGTIELAARCEDRHHLRDVVQLAIARHHPQAAEAERPALALLQAVSQAQAALVAQWMGVGFIHGVMNTDNITLSGETIDYGPCAFLEVEDPDAVFSSIDTSGRYRFGQQPAIAAWNLARLAEALLPLIADDPDEAVSVATETVAGFTSTWQAAHLRVHRAKLGLPKAADRPDTSALASSDAQLVADYASLLAERRVDHTLGWRLLSDTLRGLPGVRDLGIDQAGFDDWERRWLSRLGEADHTVTAEAMDRVNPVRIPRNHLVEEAIDAANAGELAPATALLAAVRDPYSASGAAADRFSQPASAAFTEGYVTYCGT